MGDSIDYREFRIEDIALLMADAPFGSKLKTNDYTDEGALVIQGKNIQGRTFDWTQRRYVSMEKYKELSKNHCEIGDIVFPKVGTIGKVGIVQPHKNQEHYLLSTNTMMLRTNSKIAIRDFVYYFFSTPTTVSLIHMMNSNSVQPVFNFTSLKNFKIMLPPLDEQRAIAHILGSLDDKIEANRRMNETLEETARAIFKSWFVDFDPVHAKANGEAPYGMDTDTADLFPDSFQESELGLIPRGWRVGMLKDLCSKVENGGTPRRSEDRYWQPATINWLTSGEVRQKIIIDTDNSISEEGFKNSSAKLWDFGTTVVALYGATAGQVTLLATKTTANQACCGLTPLPHARYFLQIHTSNSTKALEAQASGSAQQNLNKGLVQSFPTIIPTLELLNIYEDRVSAYFGKMILNMQENQTLTELRDTLLPRLISGELRVDDVSDFVGDV